jgi:hypothetical protein
MWTWRTQLNSTTQTAEHDIKPCKQTNKELNFLWIPEIHAGIQSAYKTLNHINNLKVSIIVRLIFFSWTRKKYIPPYEKQFIKYIDF